MPVKRCFVVRKGKPLHVRRSSAAAWHVRSYPTFNAARHAAIKARRRA